MYDTTTMIPFIVRQPGRIEAGAVFEDLLSAYDFFPTVLDLAGLPQVEDGRKRPGHSFVKVLKGEKEENPERTVVIYDEYGPVRMILQDRSGLVWKAP
jgi:arylsulfatase A-like enzyme